MTPNGNFSTITLVPEKPSVLDGFAGNLYLDMTLVKYDVGHDACYRFILRIIGRLVRRTRKIRPRNPSADRNSFLRLLNMAAQGD